MADSQKYRILISRPDRLGDVVLSTPLPREIKHHLPDAQVYVLIRKYAEAVFIKNPFVDGIIIAPEDDAAAYSLEFVSRLRKLNFSHAFMLLPNEKINYMLFLAGIKNRIGVGHKFYQFITNSKSVFRNKYAQNRHEADYCLDFVRKIGIETNNFNAEIYLSDVEKRLSAEKRLELIGGAKYLIGVHISSGGSAPNWEQSEYLRLIKLLDESKKFSVIATDPEKPDLPSDYSEILFPTYGQSLRESFLTFAGLDLLISASTGPMHICAALGVPTLSIFCPLPASSPNLWGATGGKAHFMIPQKQFCGNHCPAEPKQCTFTQASGGITAEEVFHRIEEIII